MTENEIEAAVNIMPMPFVRELHAVLSKKSNYELICSQLEKASVNFEMNGFQLSIESQVDLLLVKEKLLNKISANQPIAA